MLGLENTAINNKQYLRFAIGLYNDDILWMLHNY